MEGFCTFVLDGAAVHPPFRFDEKADKLEVSEIRALDASNETRRYRIPHTDLKSWLDQTPPYDEIGASALLLRTVWVQLNKEMRPWQLCVRKSDLDVILQKFEIEEAYQYGFTSPGNFAVIPGCRAKKDSDTLVFSLCVLDLFAVSWKYDTESGRTDSVCWTSDWICEAMQDVMSQRQEWARHPLFLALVACVMLNSLLDRDLTREVKNIATVENRTGCRGFKYTFVGIARGDYATLSQRMSGCAVLLSGLDRICKVLNEFLGDLSSYSQRYGVSDIHGLRDVNSEVEKCIESLQRRLKMQKIQIDYLSRRVEVQLTAVSNALVILHIPAWLAEPFSFTVIQSHSSERSKTWHRGSQRLTHSGIG